MIVVTPLSSPPPSPLGIAVDFAPRPAAAPGAPPTAIVEEVGPLTKMLAAQIGKALVAIGSRATKPEPATANGLLPHIVAQYESNSEALKTIEDDVEVGLAYLHAISSLERDPKHRGSARIESGR